MPANPLATVRFHEDVVCSAAVIDYSHWEQVEPSVSSLLLDDQNARLAESDQPRSQGDLILELLQHEKVAELAHDIAGAGWIPGDSVYLIRNEDEDFVVVEGNRRVAALKLLQQPQLIPEGWKRRLTFPTGSSTGPEKVRAYIAPDRASAASIILRRHAKGAVESWEPLMQARFLRSLMREGASAQDLASQYGDALGGRVNELLRLDEMYRVACSLDLPADVAAQVRNPRTFNSSVLDRLIGAPSARKLLGIDFTADGTFRGVNQPHFEKVFSRVVTDIAKNTKDTRSLHSVPQLESYLGEIGAKEPPKVAKRFSSQDISSDPGEGTATSQSSPKTTKKPTRQVQRSVIPRTAKCYVRDQRTLDVFDELKRRLTIEDHPNASAVMFRILLELAVERYMSKTGRIEKLIAKAREKDKKPADFSPSLRVMLNDLSTETKMPPLALKKLQQMVKDRHPVIDNLDGFVHNSYSVPTRRELESYWPIFESILEVILHEPEPSEGNQ